MPEQNTFEIMGTVGMTIPGYYVTMDPNICGYLGTGGVWDHYWHLVKRQYDLAVAAGVPREEAIANNHVLMPRTDMLSWKEAMQNHQNYQSQEAAYVLN